MTRRSGSEKRKRTLIHPVRFTHEEMAVLRQNAKTHGQSVGALLRASALHIRLRPSRLNLRALAQLRTALAALTGAVNKIGSNFNQFAREVNRGREPQVDSFVAQWDEFKTMFDRDMAELRIVCLQALGKEPHRGSHPDDD